MKHSNIEKSKYLSRSTLNRLFQLYVRPHLDYGDVIYHIPQRGASSGNYLMENLSLCNIRLPLRYPVLGEDHLGKALQ